MCRVNDLISTALYLDGSVDINGELFAPANIPARIGKLSVESWRPTFDGVSLKHGLVVITKRKAKSEELSGQYDLSEYLT